MNWPVLSTDELRHRASHLPRVDLAHLPTPLEEVPRFAEALGGVRVFVKRDDCTGMYLGGNKTRHNEFIMADALASGCDLVVWGAGVQSNNCRQTAAACARLGLECHLYLSRTGHGEEVQGNLLLDHLVGARVHIVDAALGNELDAFLAERAAEARAQGRRPYVWDRQRVRPLGALSYALCLAEILDQMERWGLQPSALYVSSTGATGAGLALGRAVLGVEAPVRSVVPLHWPWDVRADMADIANDAAKLLGLPHRLKADDLEVSEDHVGPGYGILTAPAREAFSMLARNEGILLDPVYTAKALAGLIADVRQRRHPGDTIVFIHTGGQPAVFAYRDELLHTAD